ncbi:hypothetical protein D9M68_227020 [compost metagenome]
MNKLVAGIFGYMMIAIHIIAVLVIVLFPVYQFGLYGPSEIVARFVAGVFYVLISGTISTLIAINENLRDINKKLQTQAPAQAQ